MAFRAVSYTNYACPKCGAKKLRFKNKLFEQKEQSKLVCDACGDTWDVESVKSFSREVTVDESETGLCEICGENEGIVMFSMPVATSYENSRPVAFKMIRAKVCVECFSGSESDAQMAARIQKAQDERNARMKGS